MGMKKKKNERRAMPPFSTPPSSSHYDQQTEKNIKLTRSLVSAAMFAATERSIAELALVLLLRRTLDGSRCNGHCRDLFTIERWLKLEIWALDRSWTSKDGGAVTKGKENSFDAVLRIPRG